MSFLNKIFKGGDTSPQVMTKKPGFAITQFTSNNPFTNIIQYEDNYYDQYILWTYKAIDYISNKVASSPINLTKQADGQLQEKHFLIDDLKAFNPYMTLWEARKLRIMHLFLTGAAAWYIDREPTNREHKVEFYPLLPTNLQIKTDGGGLPAYFLYKDADGKLVTLNYEDVLYFKFMNPENWYEGYSHLKGLRFWNNAYALGAQYNMNKLGNSSNVDKFLFFDGIGEDTRNMLENKLREKYQGVKNAGRTSIVEVKPEVIDVSPNQKDLDFVEGMKLLRQDILASFGIPEALFFPSATNSNSKEARTLFQSDTIEPLMRMESEALNEQLLPRLDKTGAKLYVFSYEDVVETDKDAAVAQAEKLVRSGIFTRNQALEYLGEEKVSPELGDVYISSNNNTPFIDDASMDEVNGILDKAKSLKEGLEEMENARQKQLFMEKNMELADSQEGILYQAAVGLFREQAFRAIDYINRAQKVSVSGIFNKKKEIEHTIQTFKQPLALVVSNSNDVSNTEIRQKLFSNKSPKFTQYKNKSISTEAMQRIAQKLEYFSSEINDVTRKKLRNIIANGVDQGFDKTAYRQAVLDTFNEYIDGQHNIDVLSKRGFYIPDIVIEKERVLESSNNRYNAMLERITQAQGNGDITQPEMMDNLKALKGLLDPSDPVAKTVDSLLTSIYHVTGDDGITMSRAVTIARTEATYARNISFFDVYSGNPFVKGKKWNSIYQPGVTRDAHLTAGGDTVPLDEPFKVGGELLMFPGDTSMGANAGNIVNCRCRITAEVDI